MFDVPGIAWVVTIGAITAMLGVLLNLILGLSRVLLATGRRCRQSNRAPPIAAPLFLRRIGYGRDHADPAGLCQCHRHHPRNVALPPPGAAATDTPINRLEQRANTETVEHEEDSIPATPELSAPVFPKRS